MNPDAALDFLDFVVERHRIWERRQFGHPAPWTLNPILATHKFTNVFRLLDPGTQFILSDLYDPVASPGTNLMRFFLYRHTGRIEVWEYIQLMLGDYPGEGESYPSLLETLKVVKAYRDDSYRPRPVFTNAYLVYPQSSTPGTDKLDSIFGLTAQLFNPSSESYIMPDWLAARSQAERFAVLRRNRGVADFMSMQVLTDWGYTTEFREDEFVVCGPGAVKGAKALGFSRPHEAHLWAVEAVRALPEVPMLALRPPSWMDVQNCLCEFSKYARYQSGPDRIGVRYQPAHPGAQPTPILPRRWT